MTQNKKSEVVYYEGENSTPEEAEKRVSVLFSRAEEMLGTFTIDALLHYISGHLDVTNESRCLDAGCMSGIVSYSFEKKTKFKMIGVDISMLNLTAANRLKRKYGFKTELLGADIDNLCFKDNSFDVVLIHNTLHHFPDFEPPLRSFRRILKEGGMLIVEDGNLLYYPLLLRAFRRKLKKQLWGSANEWPYTRFRLLRALRKTGFKIVRLGNVRFLPLRFLGDRLELDDFISKIPIINMFGSRTLCLAQK